MKIHVSNSTKKLLDEENCFVIEERGVVRVKVSVQ